MSETAENIWCGILTSHMSEHPANSIRPKYTF